MPGHASTLQSLIRCIRSAAKTLAIGGLLLGLAGPAMADPQTFEIDVYVSTIPVEGEPFEAVFYEGGAVQIPNDAIGKDGTVRFDEKFEGAAGLRTSIYNAFAKANEKFAAADVQFHIRNIVFISGEKSPLKTHYDKDNQLFQIDMKDGKSGLLATFSRATSSSSGAFRMLLAPIEEHKEVGIADTPGTVSVVDAGPALKENLNGFGLIHELTHNLGVTAHKSDPLTHAMAESVPDPQGLQTVDPKLDADEIRTIRARVATGVYDNMKGQAAPRSADTEPKPSSGSSAKPKGKTASSAGSKPKKVAKPSSSTAAKPAASQPGFAAPVVGFGFSIGGGSSGGNHGYGHGDGGRSHGAGVR